MKKFEFLSVMAGAMFMLMFCIACSGRSQNSIPTAPIHLPVPPDTLSAPAVSDGLENSQSESAESDLTIYLDVVRNADGSPRKGADNRPAPVLYYSEGSGDIHLQPLSLDADTDNSLHNLLRSKNSRVVERLASIKEQFEVGELTENDYNYQCSAAQRNQLPGEDLDPLVVTIKFSDESSWEYQVALLDEIGKCSVIYYTIEQFSDNDRRAFAETTLTL